MTVLAHDALAPYGVGSAAHEFGVRVAAMLLQGQRLQPARARGEAGGRAAVDPDMRAALAGAACLALVRSEQGHAFLDFDAPVLLPTAAPAWNAERGADASIETVAFDGHRAWRDALQHAQLCRATPRAGELLVLEGSRLYLRRLWDDERALAGWLAPRAVGAPVDAPWLDSLLRAAFAEGSPPEQVAAVRRSVGRGVSVITGGPGTGKTFVVARVLLAQGMAVALATGRAPVATLLAPTGKAARRVDESVAQAVDAVRAPMQALAATWRTQPPVAGASAALEAALRAVAALRGRAATIHAALESNAREGRRFKRNEDRPLDADLVVVDEASMVSLPLMRSLCMAVAPTASLVLLGDRAQLQSVEAGNVLSDIDGAPTALANVRSHLTQSRRFAASSGLGRLAASVREGECDAGDALTAIRLLETDDDVRAQVSLVEPSPGTTTARAVALAAERLAPLRDATRTPQERLACMAGFALLCGHRRGPGGADEVNAALLRRLAPAGVQAGAAFDGMPILILRNSSDIGVSNGDCGVVCAHDGGTLYAHFEGGRRVRVEMLPEFTAAYALTVHKSQGSEYGSLALVLPERKSPVLTRELVYTALTRWQAHGHRGAGAGPGVTVIARRDVLEAALRAKVQRASGLRDRLEAVPPASVPSRAD